MFKEESKEMPAMHELTKRRKREMGSGALVLLVLGAVFWCGSSVAFAESVSESSPGSAHCDSMQRIEGEISSSSKNIFRWNRKLRILTTFANGSLAPRNNIVAMNTRRAVSDYFSDKLHAYEFVDGDDGCINSLFILDEYTVEFVDGVFPKRKDSYEIAGQPEIYRRFPQKNTKIQFPVYVHQNSGMLGGVDGDCRILLDSNMTAGALMLILSHPRPESINARLFPMNDISYESYVEHMMESIRWATTICMKDLLE